MTPSRRCCLGHPLCSRRSRDGSRRRPRSRTGVIRTRHRPRRRRSKKMFPRKNLFLRVRMRAKRVAAGRRPQRRPLSASSSRRCARRRASAWPRSPMPPLAADRRPASACEGSPRAGWSPRTARATGGLWRNLREKRRALCWRRCRPDGGAGGGKPAAQGADAKSRSRFRTSFSTPRSGLAVAASVGGLRAEDDERNARLALWLS